METFIDPYRLQKLAQRAIDSKWPGAHGIGFLKEWEDRARFEDRHINDDIDDYIRQANHERFRFMADLKFWSVIVAVIVAFILFRNC